MVTVHHIIRHMLDFHCDIYSEGIIASVTRPHLLFFFFIIINGQTHYFPLVKSHIDISALVIIAQDPFLLYLQCSMMGGKTLFCTKMTVSKKKMACLDFHPAVMATKISNFLDAKSLSKFVD